MVSTPPARMPLPVFRYIHGTCRPAPAWLGIMEEAKAKALPSSLRESEGRSEPARPDWGQREGGGVVPRARWSS